MVKKMEGDELHTIEVQSRVTPGEEYKVAILQESCIQYYKPKKGRRQGENGMYITCAYAEFIAQCSCITGY